MTPHVAELQAPPVPGQSYVVPCVRFRGSWWPVTGPEHDDAELGVDERHLHFDIRFLSDTRVQQLAEEALDLLRKAADRQGLGTLVAAAWSTLEVAARTLEVAERLALNIVGPACETRPRRMLCRRPQSTRFSAWFQLMLEQRFENAVAQDCRTCPHRGLPLTSLPVDDEGGVTCPGHGLRWSASTGRLMPRRFEVPPELLTAVTAVSAQLQPDDVAGDERRGRIDDDDQAVGVELQAADGPRVAGPCGRAGELERAVTGDDLGSPDDDDRVRAALGRHHQPLAPVVTVHDRADSHHRSVFDAHGGTQR